MTDLEQKYREWLGKSEFDFEGARWTPSLEDTFTPEEVVKLKGRRRVVRYIESDLRGANKRLESALRAARRCKISSAVIESTHFQERTDNALTYSRQPEEYGISKEEALTLATKLRGLSGYELRGKTKVAYELVKGCNIDPSRAVWSAFGKKVLEKEGERLEPAEDREYNEWRIVKKVK